MAIAVRQVRFGSTEAERAGRSARAEYERRYARWRGENRSLLWVVPTALVTGAGTGTYLAAVSGLPVVGVLFALLTVAAGVDVVVRPPGSVKGWRAKAEAERATAKVLTRAERDGYRVLHDRHTEPDDVGVEHLVVGPTGLYVLGTENWGALKERVQVFAGQLWIGRDSQEDLLARVRRRADRVAREVSRSLAGPVPVRPMIVVHGKQVEGAPRVVGGVTVVESSQVLRYLSRPEPTWEYEQVQRVAAVAERVLPARC
jgi:hypothetical protein